MSNLFSYCAKLRQDLSANVDDIHAKIASAVERQARLIYRYETAATHYMNDVVIKDAFDSDYRLQNMDLFHADDSEYPIIGFYFERECIHEEEYDPAFGFMNEEQMQAYAITTYITHNYLANDTILKDCYNTLKITHPDFTSLYHHIHLASASLYDRLDFRPLVEKDVCRIGKQRAEMFAERVRDKLIAKIYAPHSNLFEKARYRFNQLK